MASTETAPSNGPVLTGQVGVAGSNVDTKPPILNLKLHHSVGKELNDCNRTDSFEIEASEYKQVIQIHSVVDVSQGRKTHSDAFLGALRRRECRELSQRVNELTDTSGDESWAIVTHDIYDKLNALIASIQISDSESNTREVLRQIRDTLINGNWDKYQFIECRNAISAILLALSRQLEVGFALTLESADILEAQGFHIVGIPLSNE